MISPEDYQKIRNEITSMENEIKKSGNTKLDRKMLAMKYNFLFTKSMSLFDIIYKNEYDYTPFLNKLFGGLESIMNKSEKQADVEKRLGEELFNHYVQPKLDK